MLVSREWDVVVVGAGVGGLVAAIRLAATGLSVCVLEAHDRPGGKAGVVVVDGVEADTGPSVLTLPEVFAEVFAVAGTRLEDELELLRPNPAFRYTFADGLELDLFHALEDTLASVERALGGSARHELARYLASTKAIWEAAAPHFVYAEAPRFSSLLGAGLGSLGGTLGIDAWRSLAGAIRAQVSEPHLQQLLLRYATYNGSDARRAPATLGCIAHVELALGGYGVRGGIHELVRALVRVAKRLGVEFRFGCRVARILAERGRVAGVETAGGEHIGAASLVLNADVQALVDGTIAGVSGARAPLPTSMSAYSGILRARRVTDAPRAAHQVVFPTKYDAEFTSIFDERRTPRDPTVYLCAAEACHARQGWAEHEPVFFMINAPPLAERSAPDPEWTPERMLALLRQKGVAEAADEIVWFRTPTDLARQFPGSRGAIYGAASNGMLAAFQRPPNRSSALRGLYFASGSAHPGGGLPLVALSGRQAARALLDDRRSS